VFVIVLYWNFETGIYLYIYTSNSGVWTLNKIQYYKFAVDMIIHINNDIPFIAICYTTIVPLYVQGILKLQQHTF
jgi:hypothetical protein